MRAEVFTTTTDASGFYQFALAPRNYDVTASAYGYFSQFANNVEVFYGVTTVQDFALVPAPFATISGTVTDGSGHGWPLYARIDISGAPVGPVFTNPVTGAYAVSLPEGGSFTLNVSAISAGYNAESRAIVVAPGGQTEDFPLTVDTAACTAPGYAPGTPTPIFSDDFEGGLGNWTTSGLWNPENEANTCGALVAPFPSPTNDAYYGIDGGVCTFDNGFANSGSLTLASPVLITPGAELKFWSYENTENFGGFDRRFVEISTDGGVNWTVLGEGTVEETWYENTFALSAYAGQSAQVRFRFDTLDAIANGYFGWMVDDVNISAATCDPVPGGLLVGNVFDDNTGAGLNGSTVASDLAPADTTTTFATPDDPAVDEGFYILFSSLTGFNDFTASKTGYGSATVTVLVVADAVRQQNFNLAPIPTFALTVSLAGTGTGTVTDDLGGINCGVDCTEDYPEGTVVTLTATPGANSAFTAWGGDCTGTPATDPCVLTMDAPKSVTATFDLIPETLDVSLAGTGTGTVTSDVPGIDCGVDCTEDYPLGTVVTLTATPGANSVLTAWGGDCAGTPETDPCVLTMDAPKSVTATFDLIPETLTVSLAGTGSGTVTSDVPGIDCGADCTEDYPFGTVVTLTATPDANSLFTAWGGDCAGTPATDPCVLTMDAPKSVTATFDLIPETLTVSLAGTGTGTVTDDLGGIDCGVDCTEDYPFGTVVTLTATPGANSILTAWGGDCAGTPATDPCVLTMDAPKSVTATFDLNVFAVTVSPTGTGTGTVTSDVPGIDCGADCIEVYPEGTVVTLTATAAPGVPPVFNTFAGWSGDCTGVDPCVVTMDAAKNVSANFITASSTTSFFKGKVKAAGTGAPIAGATVAAFQGGAPLFTTTTNSVGKYKIAVVAGTYDLTASAPGHTSVTKTGLSVAANAVRKRVKFKLPVALAGPSLAKPAATAGPNKAKKATDSKKKATKPKRSPAPK